MVLPTGLTTFTPTEHVAYHNEINTTAGWFGFSTSLTTSSTGHLAQHDAIHDFLDMTDKNDGDSGHITDHNTIHTAINAITTITAGSNIQTALTAGSNNAIFVLGTGTHRVTTAIAAKQGQKVVGKGGAILSGAVQLTSWTTSGSDFFATRASGTVGSKPDSPGGEDRCNITGCENPNDMFYDGAPLVRVASQAALGTGKFYEDFAANRVYIRDNPTGHTVEQAVAPNIWKPSASGTKLRNVVVQMGANLSQTGAVELDGVDSVAEYLDVKYNHGHGVRTNGNNTILRKSKIHHQMQLGIGSEGTELGSGTGGLDILVQDCEINNNNRDGSYLQGWEAAGTKWAFCQRLTLSRLWAHHNKGIGLWCDINNGRVIIEDCYVNDNDLWGIFYEISYGEVTPGDGLKTEIRDNVCDNNGTIVDSQGFYTAGAIVVSGSRDVLVHDNITRGWDGIGCTAQLRTDHSDSRGAHQVRNVEIYNNQIEITFVYPTNGNSWANAAGIKTDDTANQEPEVWTTQGNSFHGNDYFVPNHPGDANYPHWTWRGDLGTDFCHFSDWQTTYGQDTTASGGSRTVGGTIGSFPGTPSLGAGPISW